MKRYLITTVSTLVVIIALITVIGYALPSHHSITRSVKLLTPASDIWQKLSDYEHASLWNPMIERAEKVETVEGAAERWKLFDIDGGYMIIEHIVLEEPVLLKSVIVESSYPFEGSWIFELKSYGNESTLLTLTENSSVSNPFCRIMLAIYGYERSVDLFLNHLATALNQPNASIE
jgi:hypothetical protein